jgi:squalene-hopene/tetraprenyl-beta-curcumene cyclase
MPTAINGIVIWILDSTVAITVVLLVGHALLRVARQPAARQRVAEWTLAGCVLAAIIGWLPGVPRFALGLLDASSVKVASVAGGRQDFDLGIVRSGVHHCAAAAMRGSTASAKPAESTTASGAAAGWKMPVSWCIVVAGLYLAGAAVMGLRLILGHLVLARLIRASRAPDERVTGLWKQLARDLRKPTRVLVSDRLPRPAAAGLFRTVILVPRRLCDPGQREELRAVLLHELGHIERRDTATWAVVSVLQILFFHHPLFWMLRHDLQLMQEYVADAYAARRIGSVELYVQQLLSVLRGDARPTLRLLPMLGAVRGRSDFYCRMERLLRDGDDVPAHCTRIFTLGTGLVLAALATGAAAFTLRSHPGPAHRGEVTSVVASERVEQRGVAYLLAHQDGTGGWLPQTGPGVTALTLKAMLQGGNSPEDPAVRRAVAFIESFRHGDGGFYRDVTPAYNTAIVISTLALLPGREYQEQIAGARRFLQAAQTTMSPASAFYATKGSQSLYDNSSTIEALRDSGLGTGDPAVQASLRRVVSGGVTFDRNERDDDAVLANYGAITYAGLKSMLYAGLKRDDPRVRSLVACVQAHYTLDVNPGERSARGQFYYYHTFAQALRAYGEPIITDRHGIAHDWRGELQSRLAALQEPDGSWINHRQAAWLEGDPILVTTYSVLALQETRK